MAEPLNLDILRGVSDFLRQLSQRQMHPELSGTARDAQDFSARLNRFGTHLQGLSLDVAKRAILEAFQGLVLGSPVGDKSKWKRNIGKPPASHQPKGYVGGSFRRRWAISVGAPATVTGGAATDPIAALVAVRLGDRIFISNPSAYAERLNRGWSRQAPSGWVDTVLNRVATKYARVQK